MAPHVRLHLTRLLHGHAEALRGEAMLYELASAAPDLLAQAQRLPMLRSVLAAPIDPCPPPAAPLPSQPVARGNGKAHTRAFTRRPDVDVPAESQRLLVGLCHPMASFMSSRR